MALIRACSIAVVEICTVTLSVLRLFTSELTRGRVSLLQSQLCAACAGAGYSAWKGYTLLFLQEISRDRVHKLTQAKPVTDTIKWTVSASARQSDAVNSLQCVGQAQQFGLMIIAWVLQFVNANLLFGQQPHF